MSAEELKNAIAAWVEHFIHQEATFKPGKSLTPERLNELFNLLIVQGDSANEVLTYIRDFLPQYMIDIDNEITADINAALNAWIASKESEFAALETAAVNATNAATAATTATVAATNAANASKVAADNATTAATNATNAANASKTAADNATTAATTAANAANNAATAATSAKNAADTATGAANAAATAANNATSAAQSATTAATTAASAANTAATAANNAKTAAETAATSANNAAANANAAAEVAVGAVDALYAEQATGTATALIVANLPFANRYVKTIIPSADNDGVATTINGKPLYKPNTTSTPKLVAGRAFTVIADTVSNCFFIKASGGDSGTALAEDIVAPKTTVTEDGETIVGTIVKQAGYTQAADALIVDSTLYLKIPKGAYIVEAGEGIDGPVVYMPEPDFAPSNFLATKNVFGMQGSIPVKSGNQTASSISQDGNGTLFYYPPVGYYNGSIPVGSYDPDFIPANFLATKNVFGLQGSIPVFDGETLMWGSGKSGGDGNICISPNQSGYVTTGLRNGLYGRVIANDPQYLASNILSGKSIFGVAGTAKRVASSTVTGDIYSREYFYYVGGSGYYRYIVVSGLAFLPTKIMLSYVYQNIRYIGLYYYSTADGTYKYLATKSVDGGVINLDFRPRSEWYVINGSFKLPLYISDQAASVQVEWTVIE